MMRHGFLLLTAASVTLAGCGSRSNPEAPNAAESKIESALAKLSPEDRRLAEAQKWCAIQTDNRLGEMGAPIKITIKDQPVFLCCKGCKKEALADPDATLAKVEELKEKAAGSPRR
jgi:hypothetical protein